MLNYVLRLLSFALVTDLIYGCIQARPLLTRALEEGVYDGLVDVRLEGNYDTDELHRMVACAAASIRHSAKRRPKMSQV